jgi:hypothetical protein
MESVPGFAGVSGAVSTGVSVTGVSGAAEGVVVSDGVGVLSLGVVLSAGVVVSAGVVLSVGVVVVVVVVDALGPTVMMRSRLMCVESASWVREIRVPSAA